jgi:uncharacterized protein YggE
MRFPVAFLYGLACALALAPPAPAADGTVSASGTAEVALPAKALRVQVQLMTSGKDVKEALAKLHERRAAAKTLLASLGASADAVVFGEPAVSLEQNVRAQQMERMLAQLRSRPGARPADPKAKAPLPVFVVSSLKADLPLKASTPEELLIAGHDLQQKVRAADLGGLKEAEKLSPQEKELLEEMGGREPPDSGEPKPGEPFFLYVAPVSEAERDRALAEAFQNARRDAARLARAAGAGLGAVQNLSDNSQPGMDMDDPTGMGRRYYYEMAMAQREAVRPDAGKGEAVGLQPGKVVLRVVVSAQFVLKPSDK